MGEYQDDSDMLGDMLYRIAQGYMNAPDLRLASLETLLKLQFSVFFFHSDEIKIKIKIKIKLKCIQNKNFAEAGYCSLHSAALVSQCLKNMKQKKIDVDLTALPDGAKAFQFINENLLEEKASSTVLFILFLIFFKSFFFSKKFFFLFFSGTRKAKELVNLLLLQKKDLLISWKMQSNISEKFFFSFFSEIFLFFLLKM